MKKLVLLSSFALFGTFAFGANEVIKDNNEDVITSELIIDDCGCVEAPEGTCTIYQYNPQTGQTTHYGTWENVSYQWCQNKRDQIALELGLSPAG